MKLKVFPKHFWRFFFLYLVFMTVVMWLAFWMDKLVDKLEEIGSGFGIIPPFWHHMAPFVNVYTISWAIMFIYLLLTERFLVNRDRKE